ncbi:MAG: hypothetical protein JKY65_27935 [Planctomycetes bacterium]|nr:hypothetical protein [Planctomycetota bacterium]
MNQKRNLQERFDQARGWRCEYLHLLKNTTRFLREHRRLPGTTYRIGGKECPNPYWTPEVQEFLAKHRSKQLPALFAFLVDYWVHVGQRRHCYLSEPMIKDFLGMQNGARLLRYLREAPRGILHLTPGVRHPTLRIASSIEVPALPSADALDWTPSEAAEITRVNVPVKPRAKRRRRVL